MLDYQARLLAKRELARARKEAAEARVLELELDAAVQELSSSRKSSSMGSPERASRRSTPAGSVVGSPSRASRSDLNLENLRELESQSSLDPTPLDLLNQRPVPMMPGVCMTIAESSQGDVPGSFPVVVDEVAAEATMRQTFHDFEMARQEQLEEDRLALIQTSVEHAARAATAQTTRQAEIAPPQVAMSFPTSTILIEDEEMKQPLAPTSTELIFAPPVQLSSCGPEANDLYVRGLVAQATQQIETERVQKLEAEQKAKLSAQNAEQHVSQMQSAMIAEELKERQKRFKLRRANNFEP